MRPLIVAEKPYTLSNRNNNNRYGNFPRITNGKETMKTVSQLRNERIDRNLNAIKHLQQEIENLKEQEREEKSGIASWLGFSFESSSRLTEEYRSFYKDICKFLKDQLQNDFVPDIHRGYFEFFGFVRNKISGKWAYFSCSDVRFFPDAWYNELLVRTAKNGKDYIGGRNQSVKLPDIRRALLKLTE